MDNSITRRSSARLKQKPFSDLTNTHSSISKPKPKPKPKPVPESDLQPALSSRNPDDGDGSGNPNRPTPLKSKDQEPSTSAGENDGNDAGLGNVRVATEIDRRRRNGKEKVLDTTPALSCPQLRWAGRSEKIVSLENRVTGLLEALSVPLVKIEKRKRQFWTTGKVQKPLDVVKRKPVLPLDFVKKQKAYFAEIDAFELPEEEVSYRDLE